MPPGASGEVVVRGPHVLCPEGATLDVAGDRWLRTGDAGYLDPDGQLWLLGRCRAILDDRRGTLYPFQVEAAAQRHPAVRRSALASQEGRRLLLVEPEPGRRPDRDALLASLAWAGLDEIEWIRRLPLDRRHHAKVDYPALARLLAERRPQH